MDSPIGSESSRDGTIVIRVPGSDRFLEVLRSAVGRATRISGFSFDGIEDFSLVINESAVLLLESGPASLELTLSGVGSGTERVKANLSMSNFAGIWPPAGLSDGTRWQIIEALCESVAILDDGMQGKGITLTQTVR